MNQEMFNDAQCMKQAGEEENWDEYFEIKEKWSLNDGEGFWELVKRAHASD